MKRKMTGIKRPRARVGDVFRIPISTDRFAYGQVIDQAGPQHLVVVFRSAAGAVEDAMASGFDLAGITFDAKWRNGDWPIVKNLPPAHVRAPLFLLGHEGLENLRVESFDGRQTRLIRPSESTPFGHRYLSAPMRLQRAVQATHGDGDWETDLDHFRELADRLAVSAE